MHFICVNPAEQALPAAPRECRASIGEQWPPYEGALVIPVRAGIHCSFPRGTKWIPACAGTTGTVVGARS